MANMSVIDPHSAVNWSDLGVSGLLLTETVTLLLADVEVSTRLWQTQSEEMAGAVARLEQTVSEVIAAQGGVRPVEQGEGDGFVAAFARASDAVACALELQRAPLAPIHLCIGVHTGEVQLRDDGAATPVRPSTGRRGCAIWPMVGRRCCPGRPSRWSSIGCRPGCG